MLNFVDSASHYNTAQITQKWASATAVTVDPTGGRVGTGALDFDASLSSKLTLTNIAPNVPLVGASILFVGFALKPLTIGSTVTSSAITECLALNYPLWAAESGLTVFQCETESTRWYVTLTSLGAIRVYRMIVGATGLDVQGMQARLLGISGNGAITFGRGQYLEISVTLEGRGGTDAENAVNVLVRVNGSVVLACGTSQGIGSVWQSLSIGGPNTQINTPAWFVAETGTFVATDVYLADGVVTSSLNPDPQNPGQYLTYSTFLGAIKVEACFPVADTLNLPHDQLQWTPSTGLTHFNLIDSPVADDTTNVAATTNNWVDLYAYVSPLLMSALPLTDGVHTEDQLALPLLGAQWCWREAVTSGPLAVSPAGSVLLHAPGIATIVGPPVTVNEATPTYARAITNQSFLGGSGGGPAAAYYPLIVQDFCSLTDVTLLGDHSLFGSKRTT